MRAAFDATSACHTACGCWPSRPSQGHLRTGSRRARAHHHCALGHRRRFQA
jgi:hypothetical protein